MIRALVVSGLFALGSLFLGINSAKVANAADLPCTTEGGCSEFRGPLRPGTPGRGIQSDRKTPAISAQTKPTEEKKKDALKPSSTSVR
jgi:hypothetical protein